MLPTMARTVLHECCFHFEHIKGKMNQRNIVMRACLALPRCRSARHNFTGDYLGRFYVHIDAVNKRGQFLEWSISVPTVKALKLRGLLEIVSSSGDNRDNFRPECLTLTPQGVAMANLANEFGPRKMPDCFVVESDGSVVYGTLEELESYLNPEPERPHNCLPDAHFDGDTYDPARDHTRLKRQLGRVFEAVPRPTTFNASVAQIVRARAF
jgi:hypothetical protein